MFFRRAVTLVLVAGLCSVFATPTLAAGEDIRESSSTISPAAEQQGITHLRSWGWSVPSFRWVYKCTSPNRFRVTRASIRYYTTGGKWISGVHFKYRLVPHGTEGQLQLPHNWSKVKKKSWVANEFNRGRIGAGRLGQTHSTESDWDLEIKLKFVRIGHDYRRKFRIPIAEPDCTATVGPGDFGEGSA